MQVGNLISMVWNLTSRFYLFIQYFQNMQHNAANSFDLNLKEHQAKHERK